MPRTCDVCDSREFTAANPFVRACQQRPSDPSDMCCVMWGHWLCLGGKGTYSPYLPTKTNGGQTALATYDDLETWIESPEAAESGYVFIT